MKVKGPVIILVRWYTCTWFCSIL